MPENYLRFVTEAQETIGKEPARAAAALEKAIEIRPAYAPLWKSLAFARQKSGDRPGACEALRRAVFLDPEDVRVSASLTKLALELGRTHEAVQWSKKCLAAIRSGALRRAQRRVRNLRQLAAGPGNSDLAHLPAIPRGLVLGGEEAASKGHCRRAYELYTQALAQVPHSAAVFRRRAQVSLAINEPFIAESDARAAIELAGDDPRTIAILAEALATLGNWVEAQQVLERLDPGERRSLAAIRSAAAIALASGKAEEAAAMVAAAAAEDPRDANLALFLTRTQIAAGNFADAGEQIERAVSRNPGLGEAYYSASMIEAIEPGSELFRMAEALAANPHASQRDRAFAHFALGRALRREGDPDAVFAHFERANALIDVSYDAAESEEFVERMLRVTSRLDFARLQGSRRGNGRVFIVGMPRSGSTMLEQIIHSHRLAHGAGENNAIAVLARRLDDDYPDCLASLDEDAIEEMAAEYLAQVPAPRPGMVVVDKSLLNFRHLGLVQLLFPNARVLHSRRDPMDTGFSMFCHYFRGRHEYSYNLRNIAHFCGLQEKLMEHWKRVLPLAITDVSYEALIADQEGETRRILAAVGLDFDERCLDFHATKRNVHTSSTYQVRQKIYSRSVGAWRRYAENLKPLAEGLAAQNVVVSRGVV